MPDDFRGDDPWRRQLHDLSRVRDLVDEGEFAKACEAALKLRGACAAAGIRSGYVAYNVAIACDLVNDLEAAFENIREAVALDPVSLPFRRSYAVIVERLRSALADPGRAADDPSTPRLYRMLAEADEATNTCHLAMARYQRAAGRPEQARRLLEAVVVLSPAFADGWRELAVLGRELGDADLARRAETEAGVAPSAARVFAPVPHARA